MRLLSYGVADVWSCVFVRLRSFEVVNLLICGVVKLWICEVVELWGG